MAIVGTSSSAGTRPRPIQTARSARRLSGPMKMYASGRVRSIREPSGCSFR